MITFILSGSDPVTRTPNCAPNGETGREEGGIIGGLERGVGGESEIRESERGKRARGGEGNAPPVTPGGVTGDSPPQGCASTDMVGLGPLEGSRVSPWGVSDESGYPTLPGTNTADREPMAENDFPTPYGERLSDDLWTRHPALTALGRGNGEFRPGGEPRAEEYRLPLPPFPYAARIVAEAVYALLAERFRPGMDVIRFRDSLLWYADALLENEARRAESLSKNTQDAEQNAGGGSDGGS